MNWQQFGEDVLLAIAGTAALVYAAFLVALRSNRHQHRPKGRKSP